LSRSLATTAAASASVRFWIPCCVRKWNLTQTRSLAALIIEKVWLPKRCMWRKLFGMPRSDITIVTWCSASGSRVQKSQLLSALRDHLAIELRQLLDQPDVLQQRGAAPTGGHDVGVVGHRCAGGVGENLRC